MYARPILFALLVDFGYLCLACRLYGNTLAKGKSQMEANAQLALLQDLLDVNWAQQDAPRCYEDLVRYIHGVIVDVPTTWNDDDLFIEILLEEFDDNHQIWEYITLE